MKRDRNVLKSNMSGMSEFKPYSVEHVVVFCPPEAVDLENGIDDDTSEES